MDALLAAAEAAGATALAEDKRFHYTKDSRRQLQLAMFLELEKMKDCEL